MDTEFLNFVLRRMPQPKPFEAGKTYIPASVKVLDVDDYISLIQACLDGWLTDGAEAEKFEEKLSSFTGKSHISLTNSGSSANLLATMSAVESCHTPLKVVTCSTGFPTTINPAIQAGMEVLFIDADKKTLNPCMFQLMNVIGRADVGGVIVAHTLGFPFDEEAVAKKCAEHGKWFIADCSDALGAQIRGKPVGTWADMSTYSFYPAHMITAGEGGAVACKEAWLDKIIKSYREWGRDCYCKTGHDNTCGMRFMQKFGDMPEGYDHKYIYSRIGYNLRITDVQAALGASQMDKLPEFVQARRMNYLYYRKNLNDLSEYLDFVEIPEWATPSPFGFPMSIKPFKGMDAIRFSRYLENKKIGTRPVFGGNLLRQPAYADIPYDHPWPVDDSDYIMNNTLWIGVHPALTQQMREYVVDIIHDYFYFGYQETK